MQEVAWGLAGLHLRGSSRSFVKLGIGYPENRVRILLPAAMQAADGEGAEGIQEGGSVVAPSFIDSYRLRPEELHHLSLYSFASTQEVSSRPKQGSIPFVVGRTTKHVSVRTRPAIVRVYPRMSPEAHGAEYYYGMLLLHMPWHTNEAEAIPRESDDAIRDQFVQEQPRMQLEHAVFANDMAAAVARLEALGSQDHGYGGIAPGGQEGAAREADEAARAGRGGEEGEWAELHPREDLEDEQDFLVGGGVAGGEEEERELRAAAREAAASVGQGRMTDEQWRDVQGQLTPVQRDVFDTVRRHMRDSQE